MMPIANTDSVRKMELRELCKEIQSIIKTFSQRQLQAQRTKYMKHFKRK